MVIIDDYAHHPSEIAATIDAARQQYPKKKIIAVFQPHTFSRTVALMDDFAKSLDLADKVYLTEIFSSIREQNGEVSAKDLGEKSARAEKFSVWTICRRCLIFTMMSSSLWVPETFRSMSRHMRSFCPISV